LLGSKSLWSHVEQHIATSFLTVLQNNTKNYQNYHGLSKCW